MFRKQVSNLYIGKAKLKFKKYTTLPDNTVFSKIISRDFEKPRSNYLPDIRIDGSYDESNDEFVIHKDEESLYNIKHYMYVTGIPKGSPNLDYYRLKGTIWSSYYEDDYRGYLFQITSTTTFMRLLEVEQSATNKNYKPNPWKY